MAKEKMNNRCTNASTEFTEDAEGEAKNPKESIIKNYNRYICSV